jgi:hypothetical protein
MTLLARCDICMLLSDDCPVSVFPLSLCVCVCVCVLCVSGVTLCVSVRKLVVDEGYLLRSACGKLLY